MEMLRFGTTSFNDMYMHMDMEAEAAWTAACAPRWAMAWWTSMKAARTWRPTLRWIEKWNHAADDRIRVSLAPHSERREPRKKLL